MNTEIFKKIRHRSAGENIVRGIVFLIFCIFAASYLYVYVWSFLAGLKTNDELTLSPFTLPATWRFINYVEVFSMLKVGEIGFFGMLFNSVYFSVLGSFLTIMSSAMLAYVTCKFRFPGSRWIYPIVIFMITMPIYGNGGSMYQLLKALGLVNSYSQILISVNGMTLNYLYFFAAFQSVSDTYAESAQIDGAGNYTVFFRIILPQVITLFGALYLITWVADWNNYSSALLYLSKLPTLAGGIYLFELEMTYHNRPDILYAAYVISAIPPLILFSLFNNMLTTNVSLGGIKE